MVSHFEDLLLNSQAFVDKSLLIKEIIKHNEKVISIIRPKRTGKSINLSMLEKFFEIEVDEGGNEIPLEEQRNRNFFLGGEIHSEKETKVLPKLKISKNQDIMFDYRGKYPVVLLNLTSVDGFTYQQIENEVFRELQLTFAKHSYIRTYVERVNFTNPLVEYEKYQINTFFNGLYNRTYYLKYGLYNLCSLLYGHFDQRSVVLVDNYDAPITKAFLRFGGGSEHFKNVTILLKNMFLFFTNMNQFLEKSVITSTTEISLSQGAIYNFSHYTLFDEKFTKFYGFTEEEVNELATKIPTKSDPHKIKYWYNGYNFNDEVIYNPWSIMQFLASEGKFDYYWLHSGGVSLTNKVINSFSVQKMLRRVVTEGGITIPLNVYTFESLMKYSPYLVLVFEGYLNAIPMENLVEMNLAQYRLIIPNREVKQIYISTFFRRPA